MTEPKTAEEFAIRCASTSVENGLSDIENLFKQAMTQAHNEAVELAAKIVNSWSDDGSDASTIEIRALKKE